MTTIFAAGYNPDLLILTPAAAEALDTDQSLGTEKFWTFRPGNFAPRTLFGMQVRVSKTIPASAVVDAQALGRLYAAPISLASFEADAGTTNRTNVRMEGNAASWRRTPGSRRSDRCRVMGRPRKGQSESREAQLQKRATSRGYALEKDGKDWYAKIGETRFGPMRSLDEGDEFLPE